MKMPLSVPFNSNKSNGAAIRGPGWSDLLTRLVRKLLDPFRADDFDVKVKHALGGVSSSIPREYNLFSVGRKSRPPHVSGQRCQRRDTNVLIAGFSRLSLLRLYDAPCRAPPRESGAQRRAS